MSPTRRLDHATGGSMGSMSAVASIIVKALTTILSTAVIAGAVLISGHGTAIADNAARLKAVEGENKDTKGHGDRLTRLEAYYEAQTKDIQEIKQDMRDVKKLLEQR